MHRAPAVSDRPGWRSAGLFSGTAGGRLPAPAKQVCSGHNVFQAPKERAVENGGSRAQREDFAVSKSEKGVRRRLC